MNLKWIPEERHPLSLAFFFITDAMFPIFIPGRFTHEIPTASFIQLPRSRKRRRYVTEAGNDAALLAPNFGKFDFDRVWTMLVWALHISFFCRLENRLSMKIACCEIFGHFHSSESTEIKTASFGWIGVWTWLNRLWPWCDRRLLYINAQ